MTMATALFRETPTRRLGAVRMLVGAYAVADLLVHASWIASAAAPAVLHAPFGLLRLLPVPRLDAAALGTLWASSLLLGTAVVVGWRARPAALALAVTYGWWLAEHWSYGVPNHGRTAIVAALVVLAACPATLSWSLDARRCRRRGAPAPPESSHVAGWAIEVIAVQLTFLYICSGIFKLVRVGPGWWHGGAIETGIVLFGPQWSVELASEYTDALHLLALVALLWELSAPLLLVRGRCRRGYATTAIVFHLTVLSVMNVDFVGMAVAALAMFRLERVGDAIIASFPTRSGRPENDPDQTLISLCPHVIRTTKSCRNTVS